MIKILIENSDNYWITPEGRIFRGNRELKKNKGTNGYITVSIKYLNGERKLEFVHRLVAVAFIPNLENKPVVNHKNLIKSDNRVENLEWVTYKENNQHAHDNGAFRPNGEHHHAIYSNELIHKVCQLIQDGIRTIDITKRMIVPKHLVDDIRKKRIWVHISKDYIFTKIPRKRMLSEPTINWICKLLNQNKTPRQINELSEGKVSLHMVKHIKQKVIYKDISDNYF